MTSLNKTIVYLVYVQHQKNIDRLLGSSCRRSIPCIYVYRKKYALWFHKPFVWGGALQFIGKYKEYIASQMNEEINFMIFFESQRNAMSGNKLHIKIEILCL